MIYFFEGMWFYTSQQLGGSEKFYDVYYKGSEYGGAAQLELKLGKRVKFSISSRPNTAKWSVSASIWTSIWATTIS